MKNFRTIGTRYISWMISSWLDSNEQLITLLKDGTVRKTIVYISEIDISYKERWGYPKYHIFNCKTIKEMRANNRGHRYKKSLRDDGKFLMVITKKSSFEKLFVKLEVCQNCLNVYNNKYREFFSKSNFNLKYFLKKPIANSSISLDNIHFESDFETVPRVYASNWNEISKSMKEMKNYSCEECGVNLINYKKYLHTHHMDANLKNNEISNLKVLCIDCHSNQFQHSFIKDSRDYFEFLELRDRL